MTALSVDAPDPLTLGLNAAGAIKALLLLGFVAARVPIRSLAAVPVLYVLSLLAGFAAPLAETVASGPVAPAVVGALQPWLRAAAWLGLGCLPAATYLFVLQLLDGDVPPRRHFYVLAVPVLAVPAIVVATAAGSAPVCLDRSAALCLAPRPVLAIYHALAGLSVLLVLMAVARARLAGLRGPGPEREKRTLVLATILLQVVLIGLDIGVLAGVVGGQGGLIAAAALRLTFFYLVASAVFRVFPQVFLLRREPVAAAAVPAAAAPPGPAAGDGPCPRALDGDERALLARLDALMTREALYREPGLGRRQLADALGIAEHQLTRVVNVGLGRTVTELINRHRLEEACRLLATTDLPVTTIAFDVGFNSLASFNRVFKAATGERPTDLRRRARAPAGAAA